MRSQRDLWLQSKAILKIAVNCNLTATNFGTRILNIGAITLFFRMV